MIKMRMLIHAYATLLTRRQVQPKTSGHSVRLRTGNALGIRHTPPTLTNRRRLTKNCYTEEQMTEPAFLQG